VELAYGAHRAGRRAKWLAAPRYQVHIPGVGDYAMEDVSFLPDPCPLPDKERTRTLNVKERLLHAPVRVGRA